MVLTNVISILVFITLCVFLLNLFILNEIYKMMNEIFMYTYRKTENGREESCESDSKIDEITIFYEESDE
jgi:hypothetical protein